MSRRPTVAAVTVVKDEAVMLPLWEHHYGERLGLDHLVVLDDQTTDGSTTGLRAEVRDLGGLPGGVAFEKARTRAANAVASELLERFDWVVFIDADEFLLPDPERHDGLPDLLGSCSSPVVGALALNVVQDLEHEGPLDTDRPILEQRSYAFFAEIMCKPSCKSRRSPWVLASHGIRSHYEVRPDLFMLHLKFADRDLLAGAAAHRRALHVEDGRGGGSWKIDGVPERFVERMRATDFAATTEFDATAVDLERLLVQTPSKKAWRTANDRNSQLQSLRKEPVVRIPARLRGTF